MRPLAILAVIASLSSAQAEVTTADKAACIPDALKFCAEQAGAMDIAGVTKCLVAHMAQLSLGCRAVLRTHRAD